MKVKVDADDLVLLLRAAAPLTPTMGGTTLDAYCRLTDARLKKVMKLELKLRRAQEAVGEAR